MVFFCCYPPSCHRHHTLPFSQAHLSFACGGTADDDDTNSQLNVYEIQFRGEEEEDWIAIRKEVVASSMRRRSFSCLCSSGQTCRRICYSVVSPLCALCEHNLVNLFRDSSSSSLLWSFALVFFWSDTNAKANVKWRRQFLLVAP